MFDIKSLSDNLHRVFFDENALERICIPNKKVLETIVETLGAIKGNLKISNLSEKDIFIIYQSISKIQQEVVDDKIIGNGEINLILETFLNVIKENNRLDSNLDYEDVKVLCILYNVIFLKKDRHRYVERINSWRI